MNEERNSYYTRRKIYRRKRGFTGMAVWKRILVVFLSVLLIVGMTGILVIAEKITKVQVTEPLKTENLNITQEIDSLPKGEGNLTVALFGLDSRDGNLGEGALSDSIMIANLNRETGEVRIVSVFRDTYLRLWDGEFYKANAAYSYGGPEKAIAMLNENLDLNIERYIAVDFTALSDIVDAVGGVEIDVLPEEVGYINGYATETKKVTQKTAEDLTTSGLQTLNGVQATSYSRIRYLEGGDFKRAERQRTVLTKVVEKARSTDLKTINNLCDTLFPELATNFTLSEILSYSKYALNFTLGEMGGFPYNVGEDNITNIGSVVIATDFSEDVKELHKFLYGDDGYVPSSTVLEIENQINNRSAVGATGDNMVEE
jgi:LCP family protein required for cell wall assembly